MSVKRIMDLATSVSILLVCLITVALLGISPKVKASDEVGLKTSVTAFDQTRSRVFVIRDGKMFDTGGISLRLKGKQVSILRHTQWNVIEYPTGEVSWEVGTANEYECKGRIVIDPLKDNFLLVKDRDPADVRRDFGDTSYRDLLFRGRNKAGRGDCWGMWELTKISEVDASKRLSEFKYQPYKDDRRGSYSVESICQDSNSEACEVSFEKLMRVRQATYQIDPSIPLSIKPPELQVECQVGTNPILTLGLEACIKIKGQIIGKEKLRCVLANNPPISLDPELCLSGGGFVVQ